MEKICGDLGEIGEIGWGFDLHGVDRKTWIGGDDLYLIESFNLKYEVVSQFGEGCFRHRFFEISSRTQRKWKRLRSLIALFIAQQRIARTHVDHLDKLLFPPKNF